MKQKIPFMFGGLGGITFDWVIVDKDEWNSADVATRKELFLNGKWECACKPEQEWTPELKQRITEQTFEYQK